MTARGALGDQIDETLGFGPALHGTAKPDVRGRVYLMVEQEVCAACAQGLESDAPPGVIGQFSDEYPNVRLIITNGKTPEILVVEAGTMERLEQPVRSAMSKLRDRTIENETILVSDKGEDAYTVLGPHLELRGCTIEAKRALHHVPWSNAYLETAVLRHVRQQHVRQLASLLRSRWRARPC